ncbi:serine/threonine-protein kinase 35-like [Montipora capricornis]|uniref:serine/threonine-protein kinase 35-like n=1 Tax=Montipora capricornis TaxID=246305 RepID=UPI0035F2077A
MALTRMSSLPVGQTTVVHGTELEILSRLGSGAFGVVYKARDLRSTVPLFYALKDVMCLNPSSLGKAISEVETLRRVDHDFIVKIIAADQLEDRRGVFHVLILTEYCSGGTLNERLSNPSSEVTTLKWLSQMASALSYLHSRHIVHRDLKPDNVLLSDSVNENLKLGDFGLAREFLALKQANSHRSPMGLAQYYMQSGTGPAHWMAPEVFRCHYTEKADIFSLGVLFNAILVRDFAFSSSRKKWYGAFVKLSGGVKVGLGYAMSILGPSAMEEFTRGYSLKEQHGFRVLVLDALNYVPRARPRADEIYLRMNDISERIYGQLQGNRGKKAKSQRTKNSCCIT